ncbi:type II secretion system protein GspN [Candidatus Electronema sp. PJ]|uniref:type II secretion system protein GspN n=1 Tax=Candidatus Electronema sp. PJ TaxID=3401572 RepID=UPI003AA822EC
MQRMTRMLGGCGYLLYTVAVLLLMLWLQFPAAAVKSKAEAELNRLAPGLEWRIGAVGLALPADLHFKRITVSSKGEKEPLMFLDSFSLRPDFMNWRKLGKWSFLYQLHLFGGSVSGRLTPAKERAVLDCVGELKEISLDSPGLKKLLAGYGRTVSGTLSGTFTSKYDGLQGSLAEMETALHLGKGTVSLQEPVLGLKQLTFDSLRSTLQRSRAGQVLIEGGKLESKLLEADFTGDLQLTEPVASSSIHLKGGLNPRPEFLASIGGSPLLANVLKSHLQKGKLPFTVSGTLNEPGIIFAGLPTNFNQQLQGRGRQP